MKLLCVNAGSSSLKFQLVEMPEEKLLISGYFEKIGLKDSFWTTKVNGKKYKETKFLKNHTEAAEALIEEGRYSLEGDTEEQFQEEVAKNWCK